MPSRCSAFLDAPGFAALADALGRSGEADLFLSGSGCPGASRSVVGYVPRAELAAPPGAGPEVLAVAPPSALADFCFADQDPALGFLSYGYGLALRGVASAKATDFPAAVLRKYGAYLDYDATTGRADVHGSDPAAVRSLAAQVESPPPPKPFAPPVPTPVAASLPRAGYETAVDRAREHIRAGHAYQLTLSIRFTRPGNGAAPDGAPDAAGLFHHLWRTRPAPFYAFMRHGPFEVLSTSPERFLRVAGGEVLSQPIKGTLAFDRYAPGLERRLRASAKEGAELSMIVDLVRNDVSGCCEFGSVRVARHKSVFAVDRLLQMHTEVRGRLRGDRTCLDLACEAFPPGSVTGCPKRRSLEIIEALEPHARDVYCGAFLLVRGERDMDSSVAIRTGFSDARDGNFSFFAGSGITVDSVPGLEYAETMAKAEKFLAPEGA